MWRPLRLLLLCCALSGLDAQEPDQGAQTWPLPGASASPVNVVVGVREAVTRSPQRDAGDRASTAEPLEEEFDNQENVISQVSPDARSYTLMNGGAENKREESFFCRAAFTAANKVTLNNQFKVMEMIPRSLADVGATLKVALFEAQFCMRQKLHLLIMMRDNK